MTRKSKASPPSATVLATSPVIQPDGKIEINDVMGSLKGLGFERVENIPGSTYKESSTIVIVPERTPFIHHRVVQAWQGLIAPMNQRRAFLFCCGNEVGDAYNAMIKNILADPNLSKWKYVLTLESDNLPPPDAHIRLLETIEWGNYDAVSGIYFTKGEVGMPMAFGDPEEYKRTGVLDFKPRDIREALQKGNIMDVNGVAMGAALWRMDLFREIAAPWFVTVNDVVDGKGAQCFTQDLWFCSRAKAAGKRFAVDLRVKVGHLDISSGVVY